VNSQDFAARLRAEIDSYEYPRVEGTVGTMWTAQRIAEELDLLRQCLVTPTRRTLHVYGKRDEDVWLVALQGSVAVYFDESRDEFGLGSLEVDASIRDWGVYGDFVGTFMAR
jgi:hypothetical protein